MPKPLCAVCDQTNAVSTICPVCARDEANRDWVNPREDELSFGGSDTLEYLHSRSMPEPDGQELTDKARMIVMLALTGDERGERFTNREIAEMVGCHRNHVSAVLRRFGISKRKSRGSTKHA